jgi:hypothetical protein
MALTSSTDPRSTRPDAPTAITPYRLDTAAVPVQYRPIATAQLLTIQRSIEPRRNWWQFDLRPWHYAVCLASVFGCTVAVVAVVLTHSAVR